MSLPAIKSDRRQAPRTKPEGLAYINIEPNNGGIVLDISEGGLCFQSVAPVQTDGAIRFWFSAEGKRIEADGRLAWIDEKRKTGGLQFNPLSAEARRQISDWIVQSTTTFSSDKNPAALVRPTVRSSNAFAGSNPSRRAVLGRAALNAFSRWLRAPIRWAEFSRGLASGLLIGLVVLAGFLFQAHRRGVGELLIRLGERFGATPRSQASPPALSSDTITEQRTTVSAPSTTSAPRAENRPRSLLTKPLGLLRTELKPQRSAPALTATLPTEPLPMTTRAAGFPIPAEPKKAVQPQPPPESQPAGHPSGEAKVLKIKPSGSPAENTEDIAELNSGVALGKYFEIGKFKYELQAHETIEDLTRAGFQAIMVPKNFLWISSYQVLAGPYGNDQEAARAHSDLQSRGFRARSLPRRSREFSLPTVTKKYNGVAPSEDFVISWEAYSPDVAVKFVKDGDTVVSGKGRWTKRAQRYESDGVMYDRNGDGSRTLVEIWFRGMRQAVVFPTSSDYRSINF